MKIPKAMREMADTVRCNVGENDTQERNCGQYLEREELVPILAFYKFLREMVDNTSRKGGAQR